MHTTLGVVPVLVGPLQALMAILPGLLLAMAGLVVSMFKPSVAKKTVRVLLLQWRAVLAVAVPVVAIIHYWPQIFPQKRASTILVAGTDWPVWRGSGERRGLAQSEVAEPAHGQVEWAFSYNGIRTFHASPAIVGNRVYAVGAEFTNFLNRGAICSVDADTGCLVWAYAADGYRATFSSPAISGRYLVVGEGLHLTRDARIFCLDIEKSEKEGRGAKLWEYRTQSHVESSPCIYDGKVFVGAGDDGFYCLGLNPGADGKASMIWHVPGGKYLDCETSPVAANGRVYFGLGEGGKAVVCLDASDGREIWRRDTPYPVFGSPALSGDHVVVGMGIGNYVFDAEELAVEEEKKLRAAGKTEAEIRAATAQMKPVGAVWCLDALSGAVAWKFDGISRTVLGSPAIEGDSVYFASRDRHVYCVSLKDGKLLRKETVRAPVVSGLVVGQEFVYAVTQPGQLYGLRRATLRSDWMVNLNAQTLSSPAVARGHVYIGTDGGGLLCVGKAGGITQRPIWRAYQGGPGQSGVADGSLVPRKTTFSWRQMSTAPAGANGSQAKEGVFSSPLALVNDALYAGGVSADGAGLVALKLRDEGGRFVKPAQSWFYPTTYPVTLAPTATEKSVFFVDGIPGQTGRMLRCVSSDGALLWEKPAAVGASGEAVISARTAFVVDRSDGLSSYDHSGTPSWSRALGNIAGIPAQHGELLFVALRQPACVVGLDAPTGRTLWEQSLDSDPEFGPVLANDVLWIPTKSGIARVGALQGDLLPPITCGPVSTPLVGDAGRIACISAAGAIVVIDTKSGTRGGVPSVRASTSHPPLLSSEALLYCTEDGIQRFEFATNESTLLQKVYPKYDGRITSPLIVAKSHVLFGTEKRGLICLSPK